MEQDCTKEGAVTYYVRQPLVLENSEFFPKWFFQ